MELLRAFTSSVVRIIVASWRPSPSRFGLPVQNLIFMLMLASMMIPADIVLVANYRTVSQLGWINTYLGMMVVFFVSALNIFMLRQSFMTFSLSLGGGGPHRRLLNFKFLRPPLTASTLMPYSSPPSSAPGIRTWLMVTNRHLIRTVQVGVTMLNFSEGTVWPHHGGSMIILVPSLVLFLTFQKKIVNGMMAGGVEGITLLTIRHRLTNKKEEQFMKKISKWDFGDCDDRRAVGWPEVQRHPRRTTGSGTTQSSHRSSRRRGADLRTCGIPWRGPTARPEAMVKNFNETRGKELGLHANSVFQGNDTASKLKTLIQTNDVENMPDVCAWFTARPCRWLPARTTRWP